MASQRLASEQRPRKPAWLKVPFPGGPRYLRLKAMLRAWGLYTVCEEARYPNIGQYLQPTPRQLPVARYYQPQEFHELAEEGQRLRFRHVEAGPLVRSSYHAERQIQNISGLVQRRPLE